MEIKEAIKLKAETENRIAACIEEFREATEMEVENIELRKAWAHNYDHTVINITLRIRL